MRKIYRGYKGTEVYKTVTNVKCPYCGREWQEEDKDECGEEYFLECDKVFENGCGKMFLMHYDAD